MTLDDGHRWRKRLVSSAGFLVILCTAASAAAQPLSLLLPRLDFSFSNPGARSAGFGGAFAALADDATAAYANPAGLVQLTEPEVSLEARQWNRSTSFVAGGRIDGEPTGIGLDTREGILWDRDHRQELGPSFASVVIPKGRWSFALYGHQLAKFEMLTESQGVFSDTLFSLNGPRLGVGRSRTDLDVVTAGMSAGWRMNDRLSFGLGLVFSDTSLRLTSEEFVADIDLDELGEDEFPLALLEEIPFRPERRGALSTLAIDETDVTVNAGVLGKVSEQVSAGLFYRQGPKGRGTSEVEFGPATIVGDIVPVTFQSRVMLQIPDVAGGGLAWRSKDGRVTLAAEVDRVDYGGLLRVLGGGEDEGEDAGEEEEEEEEEDYQDTWEYHVGAEYAILRSTPIIAIRVGYWVEANREEFRNRELTHLTAGLGIAARSFQIDLAVDFSEEVDTTSLSCIYTF